MIRIENNIYATEQGYSKWFNSDNPKTWDSISQYYQDNAIYQEFINEHSIILEDETPRKINDDGMIAGEFDHVSKEIILYHEGVFLNPKKQYEVLGHELGHYYDDLFNFSKSESFSKLYQKHKHEYDGYYNNASEFFSDNFSLYFFGKDKGRVSDDIVDFLKNVEEKILKERK